MALAWFAHSGRTEKGRAETSSLLVPSCMVKDYLLRGIMGTWGVMVRPPG